MSKFVMKNENMKTATTRRVKKLADSTLLSQIPGYITKTRGGEGIKNKCLQAWAAGRSIKCDIDYYFYSGMEPEDVTTFGEGIKLIEWEATIYVMMNKDGTLGSYQQ